MQELITPATLKELVAANAVRSASVHGDKGGYVVAVRYGMTERFIAARTSAGEVKARKFPSLDSVDNFLRNTIHIHQYDVDSRNFEPAPRAQRHEKTSERLKQAHEAAAYTQWLKAEIQEAIDDPSPNIPHADVMRDMRAVIKRARMKRASA